MKIVTTGRCLIECADINHVISRLGNRIKPLRFVHELEKLVVGAVGILLDDAKIQFPCGSDDMSLFFGIDDSIEEIKDEFFSNILKGGILGASPIIFPFTSPNILAAQVCIVYDIRGESFTLSVNHSIDDVLQYAIDCINGRYTEKAIAGGIRSVSDCEDSEKGRFKAEFYLLEELESAHRRKAKIYRQLS